MPFGRRRLDSGDRRDVEDAALDRKVAEALEPGQRAIGGNGGASIDNGVKPFDHVRPFDFR